MLAEAGARLRAHDIATLAMAGVETVEVMPRPRVALLSVHGYYKAPSAAGSTWAPDALTPIVLSLLAQWDVSVTTLRHFVNDTDRSPKIPYGLLLNETVEELSLHHELTIQVGRGIRSATDLNFFGGRPFWNEQVGSIKRGYFNPQADGWKYESPSPWVRPIELAIAHSLRRGNQQGRANELLETCHMFVSLEGSPLSVFTGMYVTVRRLLDALEGVDSKRMDPQAAVPRRALTPEELETSYLRRKPEYNPRAQPQGVRWLDGVLANAAPRQPHGPWLQLARFDHSMPGRMALEVLPSEEWRVGTLPRAEAMVAIERGEADLPAGTPIQFFVLD